ncbi:MAG: hypothetical protein R3B93_13405 [Bacteroidia bacterium]
MKNICFYFIFLSLPFSLFSQLGFKSGFVISLQGDTISGNVKERNPQKIARICTFKKSGQGETIDYKPDEIAGFRFDEGGYFVSKTVMINGESTQVFLEKLLEGEANLYYYVDKYGIKYFVEAKEDVLYELKNTESTFRADGKLLSRENKEYIPALEQAFEKAPEIHAQIQTAEFDYKSLIDLTRKYHDYVCTDENLDCIIYRKDVKVDTYLGFDLAIMPTRLSFDAKSRHFSYLEDEKYNLVGNTYSFALFAANTQIFGLSKRTAFHYGLGYGFTDVSSPDLRIFHESIQIPVYMTYNFVSGKISPNITLGVNNYLTMSKDAFILSPDQRVELLDVFGPYQLSGTAGLGLDLKLGKVSASLVGLFEGRSTLTKSRDVRNNFLGTVFTATGVRFSLRYEL